MHTTGLPAALAARSLGILRPRDAYDVYTQPRVQFRRLASRGVLHRVSPGYYAVVPQGRVGSYWKPSLEGVAAGIAAADFGPGTYALMGISAARTYGAIPRATGLATVASPRRRERLTLTDRSAVIRFLPREVDRLHVRLRTTRSGAFLVTSPEQTLLDIAHRPSLVGSAREADEAISGLIPQCDLAIVKELASDQHRDATFRRLSERTSS